MNEYNDYGELRSERNEKLKKATAISEVFVVLCLCGWKPKNKKSENGGKVPKYLISRPPA